MGGEDPKMKKKNRGIWLSIVAGIWAWLPVFAAGQEAKEGFTRASDYYRITVVDSHTGRGVPLVELRTVNELRFYTDSAGVIAFSEPEFMNRETFFFVQSHGYEYPADGFGIRGVRLLPKPGQEARLEIERLNVAERLYRITGSGIYRDSALLGDSVPISRPLLNGGVLGQDSALALPYRNKILWIWGDTARMSYPLGNFKASGAFSEIPGRGGLSPDVGIEFQYFEDSSGFSRPMAAVPGPGVVWLDGLFTLPDPQGLPKLYGHFMRLAGLGKPLQQGLVVYDDTRNEFLPFCDFELEQIFHPRGWSPLKVMEDGTEFLYFPQPFPDLRVPADLQAIQNPSQYQGWTPLKPGNRYQGKETVLELDSQGQVQWAWKAETPPLTPSEIESLISFGLLNRNDTPFRLRDLESGKPVEAHRGTIHWNAFRNAWIMIFGQKGGESSFLGEIWFAEAESLLGPWQHCIKVASHEGYSFYNPSHHEFFDQDDGRLIYFEGTYTKTFSKTKIGTPRYDYNQIMYRLDLADPRLKFPKDP
ncbi:MAG: hypothetical protein DWQ01_00920 [Planctomycetota bacterium]|nr:MAG: hypothetical protein DWQ01_00920 [Planctomycetota bacterium]